MSAQHTDALAIADDLERFATTDSEKLGAALIRAMLDQRDALLLALEIIANGNTDPDRMVEIASEAIAMVNGQEGCSR